ncbi:MAG: hypothetical protein ACTHLR_04295, partial [Rhizomicrobium sp.]
RDGRFSGSASSTRSSAISASPETSIPAPRPARARAELGLFVHFRVSANGVLILRGVHDADGTMGSRLCDASLAGMTDLGAVRELGDLYTPTDSLVKQLVLIQEDIF